MIDKNEFGKRLENCMKTKKITNTEITKALELNKNAIGNYKNGQIPNTNILYEISNFLGISIDYLLTGKEQGELTDEEQRLVECYRKADERGKRNIIRTAEAEAPTKDEVTAQISTSAVG